VVVNDENAQVLHDPVLGKSAFAPLFGLENITAGACPREVRRRVAYRGEPVRDF